MACVLVTHLGARVEMRRHPRLKDRPAVIIDRSLGKPLVADRFPAASGARAGMTMDEAYPEVPVVRVVLDNLNTHRTASLYETFPAVEARRIAKRLKFHYTPKHGSWLNMAEIEFSVLSRSCLRQQIPDQETLGREVQALVRERNAAQSIINSQVPGTRSATRCGP